MKHCHAIMQISGRAEDTDAARGRRSSRSDLLSRVPAVPVNDTMARFLEADSDSARAVEREERKPGCGGGGGQIKGREWAGEKRKAK